MNRKKAVSVIAVILAVLMLLSLVVGVIPLTAHADELDELDELRAKKEELSSQVQEIKERIDGLKEQQANVLEQMVALMEQNRLAEEQLEIIDEEIREYEILIQNKGKEVDAAKDRENVQLEKYRTRVRAMEESGGYNILALVLQSDNFSQLITAIDDMGEIMESDRQLQHEYETAREETEEVKAQFETEKTVYEGKQQELRDEQAAIQADMERGEEILYGLQDEIDAAIKEWESAQAAEEAAAATISNVIASYNARKANERAAEQAVAAQAVAQAKQQVMEMAQANYEAIAAGYEPIYSEAQIQQIAEEAQVGYVAGSQSSGYVWPLPCSQRVTSRFGTRSDPFTGESRYHSGIDIDGFGNDGAPVIAAASGEVITASYDSAYGNYVIIDHGGTSTVYAHMSGLAVSYGQTVSQGETIGYVGATGRATGTHLHFEVYVGDERVDPAQYFSGISYYNC
jgi:murein DD-endopeptidase MepM/ murein hydrolase activator NlpD